MVIKRCHIFLINCVLRSINIPQLLKTKFQGGDSQNPSSSIYSQIGVKIKVKNRVPRFTIGLKQVGHIQTEVKIDIRHSSVNGTMSQFLHVKVIAIVFVILMFFMLMLLISVNIPKFVLDTKYHITRVFFSFSGGWLQSKIEGNFLKVREIFYYKQSICYTENALLSQIEGSSSLTQILTFPIFGRMQNKQRASPQFSLRTSLTYTSTIFQIPVSLLCRILCWY